MSFTLHIQADLELEELAKWLRSTPDMGLEAIETRKSLKGAWLDFGNKKVHLRLFESQDYDPRLVEEEEDGWLYYRYVLEATRNSQSVDDEEMKDIANELLDRVRELDAMVEILSDWDDEEMDL